MSGVHPQHGKESFLDSVEGGDPLHLPRSRTRYEGVVCPPVDFHSVSWDSVLVALLDSPAQCFFVHLPGSILRLWSPV